MAQIVNSRCVLAVRDLGVSTRYYMDVLGFRKDPINAAGWIFLILKPSQRGPHHLARIHETLCVFRREDLVHDRRQRSAHLVRRIPMKRSGRRPKANDSHR